MVGGEKSTPWFFRHSRPSWIRSPKAWSRKPTNLNLEFLSAMVNGGGEKHPLILSALQAILDKVTKSLIKEAHKSKLGIPLCHGEWWGRAIHPLILSALQAILDKVTKSLIKEAHKSKLGIPLCHGEWWGRETPLDSFGTPGHPG